MPIFWHLACRCLPIYIQKAQYNHLRVDYPMIEQSDEVLTIEEVALEAGRRTVYRLAANGQIFGCADVSRLAELMTHVRYRRRPHFVATHLEPFLTGGALRPTIPNKPRRSRQRDVLTEAGIQLKLLHEQAVANPDEEYGY